MQHTTLKVNGGGRGGSEAARGPDDVGGQGGGGSETVRGPKAVGGPDDVGGQGVGGGVSETVRGPEAVGVLMMWGEGGGGRDSEAVGCSDDVSIGLRATHSFGHC